MMMTNARHCSHEYQFKIEAQQRRSPIKVHLVIISIIISIMNIIRQRSIGSTRTKRMRKSTQIISIRPRRSLSCSTSPCCFRFPFLHNNFKGIRCQSLIHCYCLSRRVQWVLVVPWRTSQVQDLKTSRPLRLDFGSTPLFQS